MREKSILNEVSRLCRHKLHARYLYFNPWYVLDEYDERVTEERYRLDRARQINMLRLTM